MYMDMRKILLFSVLLVFFCSAMDSNAQVTSNVYTRVLKIKVGTYTGTAFTMDVDGRQYLVTAKHMVASLKQEDSIDIYKDNQWVPTLVKVLRCEEPIDIAVLIPPKLLTLSYQLDPISGDQFIIMGQEVYFVGFPFGLYIGGVNMKNLNSLTPMAMVKKGILMGDSDEGKARKLQIDGFNNNGFSGGPIVFREIRDMMNPTSNLYVLGVISGFIPEFLSVMTPIEVKAGDDTSKVEQGRIVQRQDGQKVILTDTGQVVASNTGIVIGYGIKHAVDLIQKTPLGPKVAQ
jgi:hypothetical protein